MLDAPAALAHVRQERRRIALDDEDRSYPLSAERLADRCGECREDTIALDDDRTGVMMEVALNHDPQRAGDDLSDGDQLVAILLRRGPPIAPIEEMEEGRMRLARHEPAALQGEPEVIHLQPRDGESSRQRDGRRRFADAGYAPDEQDFEWHRRLIHAAYPSSAVALQHGTRSFLYGYYRKGPLLTTGVLGLYPIKQLSEEQPL